MGFISNSQSITASGTFGSSSLTKFQNAMDTVLYDLGRDITIHLPPSKGQCASPDCQFDSFYKRYLSTNGQVCQTCQGQGFTYEQNYTIYRANLRWTNEPYNNSKTIAEDQSIGRIGVNFCRVKTVESSMSHIKESIGATIDGINVELFDQPRYTGFAGSLLYTISIWKVVNR